MVDPALTEAVHRIAAELRRHGVEPTAADLAEIERQLTAIIARARAEIALESYVAFRVRRVLDSAGAIVARALSQ